MDFRSGMINSMALLNLEMRICIFSIDIVEETSLFTPPDNLNGRRPRRPMGSAEDGAGEAWWNEHFS